MALSGNQVTQFHPYGGPGIPYSSFAGKTPAPESAYVKHRGFTVNTGRLLSFFMLWLTEIIHAALHRHLG